MNDTIINDNITRQNHLLEKLTQLINAAYLQVQELESEKTPSKVRPFTFNLLTTGNGSHQLMPRNASRDSLTIYNVGTGSCIWSNTRFDLTSILQQFSDPAHPDTIAPAPMQMIEIGYLPSGSTVTINSTEAIYVASIGAAALLTILETVYSKAGKQGGTIPIPGLDGAIGGGYEAREIDGTLIGAKGLR